MNFNNTAKSVAALCVATLSIAAHAQLQLSCPVNWNATSDIDGPNPDRVILGLKAGDWKKEHLDQMLAKEEECQRNSSDPESIKKASLTDVRTRAYPNGVRSIEARDQRQQKETARAQQVAEENQRAQRNAEAQQQQQQQASTAAVQHEQAKEKVNEQYAQQAVRNSHEATERQVENKKSNNIGIFLAVLAAAIGGWIWNKFFRNRCPKCKSTSFDTTSETEVDRWRGTKKVSETHSRGTKTRHVQTTYIKKLYEYRCKACQHAWALEMKEEL